MITSRLTCIQWIIPWFCCLASITYFSWHCHAQGGLPVQTNGIVLNLTANNVTVTEGDTVYINATYTSTPVARYVIWLKDNIPLPPVSLSSNIAPLIIRDTSCVNAGQYVLFVNNTLGSHYSNPLTVYVNIPFGRPVNDPGNPYCRHGPLCVPVGPTDIRIIEGSTANLIVNVTSNPELSFADWLYNTNPVNRSDTRYRNGDTNNPSLFFDRVQRTDAGTYTLYANNSIGPLVTSTCIFNLDPGYPPECDGCNTSACHVVNETESCILPINNIDANPELTSLQWFEGSSPIVNTTGRFLGGSIANPSLTVTNTNRNDTGNYTLTARNVYGDGRCVCCCVVQFRPTCVLLFPLSFSYNAIEGDTFRINVSLTALPVPGYVDWTLNDVPINRTGSRYTGGDTTTASLTVHQIHRTDTGLYVLHANNTVGEVVGSEALGNDCSVNVTVLYPPSCSLVSNFTLIFNEYSTITVNVSLDSVPPAHIVEWFHDGTPVNRASGRFLNGNSYEVPSLTFINVTRHDAGVYVLDATNTVGSIAGRTCSFTITVWYIPSFIYCPRNYTVCEDAPVTLECVIDAIPRIDGITWRKDGATLNISNRRYSGGNLTTPSLTISGVTVPDQGVYECVAINDVGTAVCPITLDVLSRPVVSASRTAISLVEGQSSSIGCSVDMRTNPPPVVVHWFKDGVVVNSSGGRYQHGNIDIPSLTITNIQPEDAGVYLCAAINAVGERQSSDISVTVEYPPIIHVKYNNYEFPLYTNASLWCSVDANPPVPAENITWVRDGLFTLPSTFCRDVRPNVRLCNVETNDAGVYRCRASHRLATRHSENIQVYVRDDCLMNIEGIRLSDGTPNISGRVEVLKSGTWGTVCGRYWTPLATQVVCGMFGYGVGRSSMSGAGTGTIHIGHVRCDVGATTLFQCRLTSISDCTHSEDIWVHCGQVSTTTVAAVTTTATTTTTTTASATTPSTTTTATSTTTNSTATTTANTTDVTPLCVPVVDQVAVIILATFLGLSMLINFAFICWCIAYFKYCCGGKKKSKHGRTPCDCNTTDSSDSRDSSVSSYSYKPPRRRNEPKPNLKPLPWLHDKGPAPKIEISETRLDDSWKSESNTVVKKMKKRRKEKVGAHDLISDRREKDRKNEEKRRTMKEDTSGTRSDRDTLPLISPPIKTTIQPITPNGREIGLREGVGKDKGGDGVGGTSGNDGGGGRGREGERGKGADDVDDDITRLIEGLDDAPSNDTLGGGKSVTDGVQMNEIPNDNERTKKKGSKSKDTRERKPRVGKNNKSISRDQKTQSRSDEDIADEDGNDAHHQRRLRANYRERHPVYDDRYYRAMDDYGYG